ncbi:MAG TPA: lipocalin family protein [Flavobacteriaceae bacterium]|nr:lipocalin family protein [Flavobacteriaceae bacterium]
MKRVLFLFMVVSASALTFSSCSKDDDGGADGIVGKWAFDRVGGIMNGEEITQPYTHDCPSKKDYLEFLGNGVIKSVDYDSDCEMYSDEGRWERNGDKLTVTGFDSTTSTFDIVTLDKSTLKLKFNESGISGLFIFKRM